MQHDPRAVATKRAALLRFLGRLGQAELNAGNAVPLVERDLGRSLDEVFASIDGTALAAASLAQVHRATLRDGSRVVVKIR